MSQNRLLEGLLAPLRLRAAIAPAVFRLPAPPPRAAPPSVLLKEVAPPTPIQQVRQQSAISGAAQPLRNVSIAERLRSPVAFEARNFTVSTRFEVLNALLHLDPSYDPTVPRTGGINLSGLSFSGFAVPRTPPPVSATSSPPVNTSLLLPDRRSFLFEELRAQPSIVQDTLRDPVDAGWDEATYFADATTILDATIAALRVVEGRVNAYQLFLDRCTATLGAVIKRRDALTQRLNSVSDSLAKVRHDVSVARALLADEQQRVTAINHRRQAILTEHVSFLAFHRPRLSDPLLTLPQRGLEPGLAAAEVPACLEQAEGTPPQLQATLELLRDAPLRWFALGPALLARLDRLEVLRGAFTTAQQRAGFRTPVSFLAEGFGSVQGLFAEALNRVYAAQARAIWDYRQRLVFFDLQALLQLAWQQAYEQAIGMMSLGDLIDAAHGDTELVNRAAQELMDIGRVATCLYQRVAKVLPAIRLDWALRLSEYNAPVDLRDLSSLPRWGERDGHGNDLIPFVERHAMQSLADWLYQRVAADQGDAVLMIHDLVRSCILLASHAPVDRLISGTVARETAAKVGSQIELRVDHTQMRIGMHAIFYDLDPRSGTITSTIIARAIVEDLAEGRAVVRVLSALNERLQLTTRHQVHFVEANRVFL